MCASATEYSSIKLSNVFSRITLRVENLSLFSRRHFWVVTFVVRQKQIARNRFLMCVAALKKLAPWTVTVWNNKPRMRSTKRGVQKRGTYHMWHHQLLDFLDGYVRAGDTEKIGNPRLRRQLSTRLSRDPPSRDAAIRDNVCYFEINYGSSSSQVA